MRAAKMTHFGGIALRCHPSTHRRQSPYTRAVARWPERSVAFHRWGSAANSVFVTLLRGAVHLILANPPWRQLQERAEKIPGDKKHVEGILS